MANIKLRISNGNVFVWNANDAAVLREDWRIVGTLVGCLPRCPRQNNHLGLPLQLLPEETTLLIQKGVALLLKDDEILTEPTLEQVAEFEEKKKEIYHSQIELFREERKREISQNIHLIKEGKREKRRKIIEEKKSAGVEVDPSEIDEEVEVDVDRIPIPPIPEKSSLVQLFTENPFNKEDVNTSNNWTFPHTEEERLRYDVFRDLWEQGYYLTSGSKFGGDFLVYPGDPSRFHSFYIAICMKHKQELSALDLVSMGRLGSNVRKTVVMCSKDDEEKLCYTSLQWTGIS